MEQYVLINEASELINQARNHEGFKRPSAAHDSLVKLQELLNGQLDFAAGGDQVIEEKLNPDDR